MVPTYRRSRMKSIITMRYVLYYNFQNMTIFRTYYSPIIIIISRFVFLFFAYF